jgi:uncharacterized repeat protein (TIGR03803 family)
MQQSASAVPPGSVSLSRATSSQYQVLTAFTKLDDGTHPDGGLVNVGGLLYGTTSGGGDSQCPPGPFCGIVYSVTTGGTQQVVYRFKGGRDGARPMAKLLNVYGTLYGTTSRGGTGCATLGCGTVFSVSTNGKKKVIYRFRGGSDGATPVANLLYARGVFYGTTEFGGGNDCGSTSTGCGTVFSVDTSGNEQVLHRFTGGSDGGHPVAGLVELNKTLYGTTSSGGTGYGTVFAITPQGALKTVHRFQDSPDGAYPMAPLTPVVNSLYGTTSAGGGYGKGTIFRISKMGVESVLYSFNTSSSHGDGDDVDFPLTYFQGNFYVASQRGGEGKCFDECGILYSVSLDGKAQILHEFDGGTDGCYPSSGLVALNETLYGVTTLGGSGDKGCRDVGPGGTVYSYTP